MKHPHIYIDNAAVPILHNLAPDADGIISPVDPPEIHSDRIATFIHPDGSQSIFSIDGNSIAVTTDGMTATLGELPAQFRCCAATRDSLIIMTEGTMPVIAKFTDSAWQLLPSFDELPPLSFAIDAASTFSAVSDSAILSDSYPHWTGPLSNADRSTITERLISAYNEARKAAATAGYFSQPMMTWYTLIDSSGMAIFRSIPVIIAPTCGYNGLSELAASVANGVMTGSPVSISGFTVALHIPDAANELTPHVAGARIYMAPLPDPIDTDSQASVTFGQASTSGGDLSLLLPADPARNAVIPVMLDNLDKIGRCVARIASPFANPGKVRLSEAFIADRPAAHAKVAAALNADTDSASSLLANSSLPHSFSAGAAASAADMIVWGDITPVHAMPAAASQMVATPHGATLYSATTRITLASGETLSNTAPMSLASTPSALSPLITYFGPDATLFEIDIYGADGSRFVASIPLRPSPGGKMSWALSDDLKPWQLSASQSAPLAPINRRVPERHPGCVVSAAIDSPLQPDAAIDVTQAPLKAILPAPGSGGTWNFVRRHLYAFATDGTYSLAVNAARTVASVQLIDRRGIVSTSHVATLADSVYLLSAGSLLKVSGSHISTVLTEVDADALLPIHDSLRLACIRADNILMVNPDTRYYTADSSGTVRLRKRISLAGIIPRPLRRATWLLTAANGPVTLRLCGDNGNEAEPVTIAERTITSAITAPVMMTPLPKSFRYITVYLEANANSKLLFDSVNLTF